MRRCLYYGLDMKTSLGLYIYIYIYIERERESGSQCEGTKAARMFTFCFVTVKLRTANAMSDDRINGGQEAQLPQRYPNVT